MTDTSRQKLIIIAGPTAAGKSSLAVDMALKLDGEIISADSVQVYRGMDIGSAKITREEMRGVPHHLIDVMDITGEYNAVCFKRMAVDAVRDIAARGHIPIVCGGTGFYIQALLYDIAFEEENRDVSGKAYRRELEELLQEHGKEYLNSMLKKLDPYTYITIDRANTKKVMRALEFYHFHGYSFGKHNEEQAKKRENSPYDYRYFVLYGARDRMYRRIDERVDRMMEAGLLEEVKRLKDMGLNRHLAAGQAIGYKEMLAFLNGECSLDEAAERIKINTRHFAKRQLTWFRREKNAVWINIDEADALDETGKYI